MTQTTGNVIPCGASMGRIRQEIQVDGRACWTLFDSGARYSYITEEASAGSTIRALQKPRETKLGGATRQVTQVCLVEAEFEGHSVHCLAYVLDEIGTDEDGRDIDMLLGALAMQGWGIKLDLQNEKLDLTHFSTDLTEF